MPLCLVRLLHHVGCCSFDGGKILVSGGLCSLEYAVYLNGRFGNRAGGRNAKRPVLQLLPQRLIFRKAVFIPLLLFVENIQQFCAAEKSEILIAHDIRSLPACLGVIRALPARMPWQRRRPPAAYNLPSGSTAMYRLQGRMAPWRASVRYILHGTYENHL